MLDIQALLTALTPNVDAVVLIVLHRSFSYPSELRDILGSKPGPPRNWGRRVVTSAFADFCSSCGSPGNSPFLR
jgi:hypothetical protein